MIAKPTGNFGTLAKAVVKVGRGGRGFIIKHRREYPPYQGQRSFKDERFVVTAAHCLPRIPRHLYDERPYKDLLGILGSKPSIWAACRFVDPVGDIAVLSEPDNQSFCEQFEAYEELTDNAPALRIGRLAPGKTRVWMLSLSGEWMSAVAEDPYGYGLWIKATSAIASGMSGSPILRDDGFVVGVVSQSREGESSVKSLFENGPQPVLVHHLPGWLLRRPARYWTI